jgi:hypothetical protein
MPKYKSKGKSKKQKMYRMKGCSNRKTCRKRYLGGSADVQLAYPSNNVPTVPNTNLAYNPISRAYPATPSSGGFNFLTPQTGGQKAAAVAKILGGSRKHRTGCHCSRCKNKKTLMGGGCGSCNDMSGPMHMNGPMSMTNPIITGGSAVSNNGIPYPNGLLGDAWTPDVKGWPGIDGVSMNRNHLGYNTYSTDVSRQMTDVGANPPYTYLKGGRKGTRKQKKRQRGGTLSNYFGQDLINLGSQFQYNAGSSWNALRGNAQTANPLPWKDQMARVPVPPPQ